MVGLQKVFSPPKIIFFDYIFVAKHLERILKGIREGKDVPEYFDKGVGLCGNFQKVGESLGTKELDKINDSFCPIHSWQWVLILYFHLGMIMK